MDNVISSAKTDMFRIRMNPEIREDVYKRQVTDATTYKRVARHCYPQGTFSCSSGNSPCVAPARRQRKFRSLRKRPTPIW